LQAAQAEAGTPLWKHLEDGFKRWAALADHRMKWAEHCEHGKVEGQTGNFFAKKALEARGKGREMAVKLMDAGLRALQAGDVKAHETCMQVCKDLGPLTTQDGYVYEGKKRDQYDTDTKESATIQILQYADHSLRAITAGLDGKAALAAAWQAAASARDKALTRYAWEGLYYHLRYDAEDILQRADALAEKARALEQTV
jgi:phage tail tube protein FII